MEGSIRAAPTTHTCRHGLLAVLLVALAACGGGGGADVPPVLGDNEAIIGPEGGTLMIADGPHAGVALAVPPDAVLQPTRFRIDLDVGSSGILSLFPVHRFEPTGLITSAPLRITLPIGEDLIGSSSDGAAGFRRDGDGNWLVLRDHTFDPLARTVTSTTQQLGAVLAWNGGLHRLFTQQPMLPDPSEPVPVEYLGGTPVTVPGGSGSLQIGRGSLQSFWSSDASVNLLLIHGLIGSPVDFLGPEDLIASLPPQWQNVIVFAYPSAAGVVPNANWLYDQLHAGRQPGFGCSIIGHSMGGLVGRYLLERSAADPARAGYRSTDQPLGATVANLILLGVPNAGSELGSALVESLLPRVPEAERALLQAALDLSFRPEAVTMLLNANYVDNPTRYHVLYGDVGSFGDGVVSVASALALPLFSPETATRFLVGHDELHRAAASNGVTARIHQLLNLP